MKLGFKVLSLLLIILQGRRCIVMWQLMYYGVAAVSLHYSSVGGRDERF